jgi:uncharacterized protein YndB with AHSA1/START domain
MLKQLKQPMETKQLTIETIVAANLVQTWTYWNEPEHIIHWNFADDSWHCPRAENDLRVGGMLKSRMEAKDGSFGFDFEAVYNEVRALETIAYIMTDGRKARTTFKEVEEGTKMTTIFDAERENPIEMQQKGWQAILDNFKTYVESKLGER